MNSTLDTVLDEWQASEAGCSCSVAIPELADYLTAYTREAAQAALELRTPPNPSTLAEYAARVWQTIMLHFEKNKLDLRSLDDLQQMVGKLTNGQLYYGEVTANVLWDVIVARGLEELDNHAAAVFDRDFMPSVRFQAERFAGQSGLDAVENLAADLVMPREGRPPKIATFRGVTPLKSWLRSIVVNTCTSTYRKKGTVEQTVEPGEPLASDTVSVTVQAMECEHKLAPAFQEAVGQVSLEDRVLLKMLVLDGTPQKDVAAAHGIDPGTLTRRKQRAATNMLNRVKQIGVSDGNSTGMRECLELLLAGDSHQLRGRLASMLATEVRRATEP